MKGIDKRQTTEDIRIPNGDGAVSFDIIDIEMAEEDTGIDGVGPEEHFIGEDEGTEEDDNPQEHDYNKKREEESMLFRIRRSVVLFGYFAGCLFGGQGLSPE